jgi:hypothetical protein
MATNPQVEMTRLTARIDVQALAAFDAASNQVPIANADLVGRAALFLNANDKTALTKVWDFHLSNSRDRHGRSG